MNNNRGSQQRRSNTNGEPPLFGENLYPIKPKRPTVLGVKAFPKIADVLAAIDLAVIARPAFIAPDVLDWSLREQVEFSAFLSIGSMLDVGWGDLIAYLADDFHISRAF